MFQPGDITDAASTGFILFFQVVSHFQKVLFKKTKS